VFIAYQQTYPQQLWTIEDGGLPEFRRLDITGQQGRDIKGAVPRREAKLRAAIPATGFL